MFAHHTTSPVLTNTTIRGLERVPSWRTCWKYLRERDTIYLSYSINVSLMKFPTSDDKYCQDRDTADVNIINFKCPTYTFLSMNININII